MKQLQGWTGTVEKLTKRFEDLISQCEAQEDLGSQCEALEDLNSTVLGSEALEDLGSQCEALRDLDGTVLGSEAGNSHTLLGSQVSCGRQGAGFEYGVVGFRVQGGRYWFGGAGSMPWV